MKYFDKNYSKWQRRQQVKEDSWHQSNRELRRTLDRFAINYITDKDWWKVLSWVERENVRRSYYNTLDDFKQKFSAKDPDNKGSTMQTLWYNYDPDIADVSGGTWEECIPQWLQYVTEKYPQDANVRRELAIRRIFS